MKLIEIKSIEIKRGTKWVYDIEVEKEHHYIANRYVVHNCTTSCNVGVHYPSASLIDGLRIQKEKYEFTHGSSPTKIIADGGIKNFDEIQKCICLGADAVMSGNIFAKSWEACGEIRWARPNSKGNINIYDDEYSMSESDFQKYISANESAYFLSASKSREILEKNYKPYREYYGMSTKKAQKITGGSGKKTSEGIIRPIPIEYHIDKWAENMKDYLASCMSYCGVRTIDEFRKEAEVIISLSGDKSFKK